MVQVLYEDNHLIAVYKPAGILVQEDKTGDPSLLDQVKYYLKNKYHKPGKVFLGLIHRLDRPVAGVILFAKTSKGASRLSEQFRLHQVEKIYHALVVGEPKPGAATLVHYLVKDKEVNKVSVSDEPVEDGLRAELSYSTVKTNGKFSILKIKLGTGRPHQIRSQLSAIGNPIVADVKYGAPPSEFKSLCLMATSLSFTTATGEEKKEIFLPIPSEWEKLVK